MKLWIKYAAVVLAIVTTGAYAAFDIWRGNSNTSFSVKDEQVKVEQLFKKYDVQTAYKVFKAETDKLNDPVTQHDAAHVFGEALYAHEGIDGMTVCDSFFGFGCFHSFIAAAVAEHGIGIVTKLDRDCVARYGELGLGCSHGIGHGMLSYFGYNFADLKQALEICEKLSWRGSYGGCAEGVFMEYNFRTVEAQPERRLRSITLDTKLEPCASLPARFRLACYFSQPDWWWHALQENEALLPEMGSMCGEAGNIEWLKACFRGIGYAQATAKNYDVAYSIHACDAASKNRERRVWCREGVAWAFYANPQHLDSATNACFDDLTDAESERCLEEYIFFMQ